LKTMLPTNLNELLANNTAKACLVKDCCERRDKASRYCHRHLSIYRRSGHPEGSVVAAKLDFAVLGRIAGDVYQAVEQPIGIFCTLSVMR
jgi:hypothetical protein